MFLYTRKRRQLSSSLALSVGGGGVPMFGPFPLGEKMLTFFSVGGMSGRMWY